MSDGMDNGLDAGGELSPEAAELASLLPDEGGDETNAGSDRDPTTSVLKQFDDDPAKLADSYANLRRKLSQQGSELGEARKLVAALTGQLESVVQTQDGSDRQGSKGSDLDAFMHKLKELQDNGEQLDITSVVGETARILQGELHKELKPLQDGMLGMTQAITFAQYLENNPSAKPYSRLMQGLIKQNPHLLPTGLRGDAFTKQLEMIHDMARGVELKLRGTTGAIGRGNPDSGRTRRVNRRESESTRELTQLAEQFKQTGSEQYMADLVERVLSK